MEDIAGQVEAGITQVEKVAGAGYFDQIKETGAIVCATMFDNRGSVGLPCSKRNLNVGSFRLQCLKNVPCH